MTNMAREAAIRSLSSLGRAEQFQNFHSRSDELIQLLGWDRPGLLRESRDPKSRAVTVDALSLETSDRATMDLKINLSEGEF